jgi:hypothetical protein
MNGGIANDERHARHDVVNEEGEDIELHSQSYNFRSTNIAVRNSELGYCDFRYCQAQ